MLHLIPDGSDGFFVFGDFYDPIGDLQGGIGLALIGALCIGLPIGLIIAGPDRFMMALFSLLCSLFVQLYCTRRSSLFFLTPLALIFNSYALLSGSWAMMANAKGEAGLLMLPILAMILIVVGAALYLPLLGEFMGVMWTLVFGVVAWGTALYSIDTENQYRESPAAFYTMRIVTIIALIYMAVLVIQWFIQLCKGKFNGKELVTSLTGFGIGLLPVVGISVVGMLPIFTHDGTNIAVALGILAAYAALAIIGTRIVGKKFTMDLCGGTILTLILYYGSRAQLNAPCEFMDEFVDLIQEIPYMDPVFSFASAIATSFQCLFTELSRLIVNLILRVFDQSGLYFEVPSELALLIAVILILLEVVILSNRFGKK